MRRYNVVKDGKLVVKSFEKIDLFLLSFQPKDSDQLNLLTHLWFEVALFAIDKYTTYNLYFKV